VTELNRHGVGPRSEVLLVKILSRHSIRRIVSLYTSHFLKLTDVTTIAVQHTVLQHGATLHVPRPHVSLTNAMHPWLWLS